MFISDKHFAEFKRIYKEEFGEEKYNKLTDQQLLESATKLITLMKIVYKPISKEDYEKYRME